MDDLDRRLLDLLQTDFAIVATPFALLAEALEVEEDVVLQRTQALIDDGLIRRFGVSADSRKIGFVSTLVGTRVRTDRLDESIALINSFAEVTHNYEREEELNIWFTVIARDEARKEEILDEIRAFDGVEELLDLPATHVFKINVQFKMSSSPEGPPSNPAPTPAPSPSDNVGVATVPRPFSLHPTDLPLLRELRDNLPVTSRPFAVVAESLGLTEELVLTRLQELKASGAVRKLGAFLRHHRAGYNANGMVVWKVPEEDVEAIGKQLALQQRVTHAYARPASERWPYRLYTMLHGRSRDEVIAEAKRIADEINIADYHVVFSSRELKKTTPPLA